MALFDVGKGLKRAKGTMQGAMDSVKNAAKDVKIPDVKVPDVKGAQEKLQQIKGNLAKRGGSEDGNLSIGGIRSISTRNALKIFYYLMAADGRIFDSEEEKFDAIGLELDPLFAEHRDQIVKECQAHLEKIIDPEDYFDVLRDGVDEALRSSRSTEDTFITPKLLLWDLMTIAYSDGDYDETERKILKQIVYKLNIDKAVFLELENSILTLMDLEKELQWIKTTDRPYLTIEMMVNEIADRKNMIFDSVKDLITL